MFYPRISRTLIILYTTVTITVWLADFLNDMLYFTNYTAKIVLNRWCEQILSLVSRWLKLSDSWCWVLFTVTLQTLQETLSSEIVRPPTFAKSHCISFIHVSIRKMKRANWWLLADPYLVAIILWWKLAVVTICFFSKKHIQHLANSCCWFFLVEVMM